MVAPINDLFYTNERQEGTLFAYAHLLDLVHIYRKNGCLLVLLVSIAVREEHRYYVVSNHR
jgi:hypothetical protein